MNKLRLKIATPEYVVYFYYPEGEGEYGEIRMNIDDGEAFVVSRASGDTTAGMYAFKATRAVKECVQDKNFPLEFSQAWH
ncbi:MAG: hypothetical protein LBE35_00410 [Clostridiales bacterium]|nr:hypothetical protein [Clostridiales bacterium]